MKCDTCEREAREVRRVVVDQGYDRSLAKAVYNCPECYAKKEARRSGPSGGNAHSADA